jgi:nucleoside-diphosphate-sugar epimerase
MHLAWVTQPGVFATAPNNVDWLVASLQLMRAFHESGGQRIVMSGTCAEYDWSDGYCSEATTPLNPSTLYGRCKLAMQSTLDAYSRQTGLSSAWGRLFFIYGPHAHPNRMPGAVINSLLRDEPALCSHGEQIRDFLHVRDVASALVALLDSELQGPINVASGQEVVIRDMVQQIADRLDRRHLLRLGALPQSAGDPPRIVADVRRLSSELAWRPALTLAAGLEDTLKWWQGAHRGCTV